MIVLLREASAGAVIFRNPGSPKYLLLKPQKESVYWDFPKGNIEKNEKDPLETAKREIEEETGLTDLKFFPKFIEKISYFYKKAGELVSKDVIFFLAESVSGEVKLSFEHVEYGWFEFVEAVKRLRKNSIKILQTADDFLKTKI